MTFKEAREEFKDDSYYLKLVSIEYELYMLGIIKKDFFSDISDHYPKYIRKVILKIADHLAERLDI